MWSFGSPAGFGCDLSEALSAGLFQGVDNLLQDVGAVVGYLLQNRVGVLLQLSALLLTHLQLPFQLQGKRSLKYVNDGLVLIANEAQISTEGAFCCHLFHTHLLQLLLPVFGVAVVIVRRWRELAEDAGVPIVAQVCQVGDVDLELAAVLG